MYVTGIDSAKGIRYLEEALSLLEQLGQKDRAAQMHCRLGFHLTLFMESMDLDRALRHLRAAEAVLGQGPPRPAQAYLYIGLAGAAIWGMRNEEGLRASSRALEIADELGSEALWANAAVLHGWLVTSSGKIAEGLDFLERGWEVADRLNHVMVGFLATWFRCGWGLQLGDPRTVRMWAERELAKPQLAQAPVQRLLLGQALAFAHHELGNLPETRRIVAESKGEERSSAWPPQMALAYGDGDWGRVATLGRKGRERLRRAGNRLQECMNIMWIGRMHQFRGELSEAESVYREGLAVPVAEKTPPFEALPALELALLLIEAGRLEEARKLVERGRECMVPLEAWCGSAGLLAQTEAALAAAEGQLQEADARFADAIAAFQRYGFAWYEAHALHHWGRALLAAGERTRAIEKLDAALELYQRMGWGAPWIERVLADKLRAQGVDASDTLTSIDAVVSAVERERPDLQRHAAPDGTVTLMFSDMEGFTQMTERLGDRKAHLVIRDHNRIVREQIEAFGGYEVELQGDGFLLAFASARRALDCGISIQRAFEAYSEEHQEQPIRVRIGLHTGEAIREAHKFFGKSVILAARIAAQALAGEILVSSLVKELTASAGDLSFGKGRSVNLKGLSGAYTLHPVVWTSG
jgi:class 3 adenylate cyclase